MVKIIETNLIIDDNGNIADHQSRVIEDNSWKEYVNNFENNTTKYYSGIIGSLHGDNFSSNHKIKNLKYNDFHLSCDVYDLNGELWDKKLAYLIREV